MATRISDNFTLEELCESEKARTLRIDNIAKGKELENLKEAVTNMLQPLRTAYGKPIKVNSGYRCDRVNELVGGSSTSSHRYGFAFDIKPTDGNMKAFQRFVLEWAKDPKNKYDQIIIEKPNKEFTATWIHIGYKRGTSNSQRRQILSAYNYNGSWKYYNIQAVLKRFM